MVTTKPRLRCEKCGHIRNQYSTLCSKCHKVLHERAIEKAQAIVTAGVCPQCGAKLRRNSAMAGWWQCEQYDAPSFRTRPEDPACSFQCFTE